MDTINYTRIYRIIHWTIAITFLLLLITIFLRLTWMNKFQMADIIQEYMKGTGQTMSYDEIVIMAKQIRKPMWQWHIYLGYVLVGLFSIRFILPAFGEMKFQNPMASKLTLKATIQKWSYLIFYLCVVGSLITGLLIEWGPKEWKKPVEEIHELGIYYLVGFIVIHLAGVLMAEFTIHKGIISRIVRGDK